MREALVATVRREFATHQLHAFLRGAGLGPRQAAAVVRKLGPDCEPRLRADPYWIAGRVSGIGFAVADQFARRLGLSPDAPERCRAGLLHVLREAAGDGHTLLPREELFAATEEHRGNQLIEESAQQTREAQIERILRRLDDREQRIIIGRFGLDHAREPQTLKEVGASLGVTKERIRQIEARALTKLREAAKEEKIVLDPLD